MPLPLVTERLMLRVPIWGDVAPLRAVFTDPKAMRYIGSGQPWSEARMRESMRHKLAQLADRGFTLYTVVRRVDSQVVGDCGLNVWSDTAEIEIGWRLARRHWRRGYATEAASAVFDYARAELALTRLICMVDSANTPSRRIAEHLGLHFDTTETHHERAIRRYVWHAAPTRDG